MGKERMSSDYVHVVIPTLGYSEMLQDCVDSIEKHTSQKISYDIMIINTKSTENDDEISKNTLEKYENISCKNTGYYHFAKTNNEAVNKFLFDMTIHCWDNDFVVFCNNDIVFQNDCITNMLDVFRGNADKKIGTVGSLLLFPDNSIQHIGVGLDEKTINCYHVGYKHQLKDSELEALYSKRYDKVPANTAALMMMKTYVFKNFNGFDEEYKVCFEDLDLNLRLGMAGFDNYIAYNSIAVHRENSTRGTDINPIDYKRMRISVAKFFYEKSKQFES